MSENFTEAARVLPPKYFGEFLIKAQIRTKKLKLHSHAA